MKTCHQDAIGAGQARTQGAFVAALRMRRRTTHHTAKRELGGPAFIPEPTNREEER